MDLNDRIAARRAEIERERREAGGGEEPGDLHYGSAGGEGQEREQDELGGAAYAAAGGHLDVQQRIAARRAEIEQQRRDVEATARAARAAKRAAAAARWSEERAAPKKEWTRRVAALEAKLVAADPVGGRSALDAIIGPPRVGATVNTMLAAAVRRQWTTAERLLLWFFLIGGASIFAVSPIAAFALLVAAAWRYGSANTAHEQWLVEHYPDLFGPATDQSKPAPPEQRE